MTNSNNKPSHRIVRYYGTDKNSPSAEVGAVWQREDGSLSILLNTLDQRISLYAFPRKEKDAPDAQG